MNQQQAKMQKSHEALSVNPELECISPNMRNMSKEFETSNTQMSNNDTEDSQK